MTGNPPTRSGTPGTKDTVFHQPPRGERGPVQADLRLRRPGHPRCADRRRQVPRHPEPRPAPGTSSSRDARERRDLRGAAVLRRVDDRGEAAVLRLGSGKRGGRRRAADRHRGRRIVDDGISLSHGTCHSREKLSYLSGKGSPVQSGAATTTLTGAAVTYTGTITVSKGTLVLRSGATLVHSRAIRLTSASARLDVGTAGLRVATTPLTGSGTVKGSVTNDGVIARAAASP
ncbi:hypothetical protein ACRAWF_47250 [Streptomyces sp. L7]